MKQDNIFTTLVVAINVNTGDTLVDDLGLVLLSICESCKSEALTNITNFADNGVMLVGASGNNPHVIIRVEDLRLVIMEHLLNRASKQTPEVLVTDAGDDEEVVAFVKEHGTLYTIDDPLPDDMPAKIRESILTTWKAEPLVNVYYLAPGVAGPTGGVLWESPKAAASGNDGADTAKDNSPLSSILKTLAAMQKFNPPKKSDVN